MHAPAEFQLHRRRRRDERFGEKIDKAPPSKTLLNFALIAHTATRYDVIDAHRRTRTHFRVSFSRVTGFQSHRPRSPNTRRRFASSDIGSCAKIGDDSERAVAGVARRDEAVNDAARWLSWTKTLRSQIDARLGSVALERATRRRCERGTPPMAREALDEL